MQSIHITTYFPWNERGVYEFEVHTCYANIVDQIWLTNKNVEIQSQDYNVQNDRANMPTNRLKNPQTSEQIQKNKTNEKCQKCSHGSSISTM